MDEWYPELIEVEERAKDSASLLFFVIDSQTRAVSSMVEIAFFAGELIGHVPYIAGIFGNEAIDLHCGRFAYIQVKVPNDSAPCIHVMCTCRYGS